jgi:hypothetical protein
MYLLSQLCRKEVEVENRGSSLTQANKKKKKFATLYLNRKS